MSLSVSTLIRTMKDRPICRRFTGTLDAKAQSRCFCIAYSKKLLKMISNTESIFFLRFRIYSGHGTGNRLPYTIKVLFLIMMNET